MNYKKIVGLVIFLLGVGLLIYGFYGKERISEAREDIDTAAKFIPKNPFKSSIQKKMHSKVDAYELPVKLLFVGGVACIVIGGVIFFLGKKRKNN